MIKNRIKTVIADSNRLTKVGLQVILSKEEDIDLCAEAESMEELTVIMDSQPVDVVLMDFTTPGFSLELIPNLLKNHPNTRVVAITPDQEAHTIINALKAGVTSYVKKDCDFNEIISSVRDTAAGSKFFCGKILETIHLVDIDPDDEALEKFDCEPVQLSAREQEIITLIAEGMTNTAIAEQLFLSPHTVNTHRKNIMHKLGVTNTASIVMYAVKTRLVNVNKFLFSSR
jgi:DNA-binding NarL/FixJ family response regulator